MTPITAAAACRAAGLSVLSAQVVGRQVAVTVKCVPQSADGLKALAARLGVGGMTVSTSNGATVLWFMETEG